MWNQINYFHNYFFLIFPKQILKKKLELSKDIRQIERFFWPGLFYIFWLTCALYEKIDVIKIKKRWITYHKKRAYEQDLDSCVFFEVVVSQKGEQLSMTSQKRLEEDVNCSVWSSSRPWTMGKFWSPVLSSFFSNFHGK